MKKIYSLFMALSFVLCAMANSPFVAENQLNLAKAKNQFAPVEKTAKVARLNKQDARQAMVEARQAKAATPMAINGVRQIEAVPTAVKQAIPTNVASKAPAKAAAAATDTVEIAATFWAWEYYESDNDWYTTLIDATETYEIKLDYVSTTQAGTFTEDNCIMDYTGMYIYDEEGYSTIVRFAEVDIVVTDDENGLTLHAELLSTDNVLYIVDSHIAPLPEPKATVELAYANATLVDGTRSSETFQFWGDENGVYTSILLASEQVEGVYDKFDMYVAYANYIMFVDGTDTTFVDFLDLNAVVTKEGKTYNLVADALGSDTIMYHITMSYTKPDPTDTIDIVATNLYIDEFEFIGMVFTTATASNDEYEVTFDLSIALEEGEYATEDFNASYCGIVRTSDMEEIAMTEITATVTGEGGDRVIKAEVVGSDNVLYNMDLSYVVPEATDTVNVVFDDVAEAEYYAASADYYIVNQNENYLVSLDIFEERGNLMGEYTAEDFDLYYTQLGVIADGDTTVVTIAEAKAVVTATDEEDIVLIEAELTGMDAVLYKVSTKAKISNGLQYDATEGFLVDEYTTEDLYTINDQSANGYIMFDVEAADGSDLMGLVFWVDGADENTIIPTGTYQINTTGEAGTVMASTGMGAQGLTYSLYATLDEEGYIVEPCWFMVGGEVVVSEKDGILSISVDAVNSNNLPIFITCEYQLNAKQGLPYDATEGAVDRTYTAEDNVVINKGNGYFQVQAAAADGSDKVAMVIFGQENEETIIPVGTYQINDTQAAGTVLASTGVNSQGQVSLSLYAQLDEEGYLVPPCYFFVGGTVEVSAADGKLTIEVNAVNSYDVPVHAVIEYALDTKQGLQYDMTEGNVNRTYSDNDKVEIITDYVAQYGELYLSITAADGSDKISVAFSVEATDSAIVIPAGTYPITNTGEKGTVFASSGVVDGSIYPSFYGKLSANGGIVPPCYFMVGGNVVVENIEGHLKVTIDALNSYDVPAHIVYEADPVETSIDNVTVHTNASKVLENNQLFIIKDGVKYNVMGSVVK